MESAPTRVVFIEGFGDSKQSWFKSFLELPNGIPYWTLDLLEQVKQWASLNIIGMVEFRIRKGFAA